MKNTIIASAVAILCTIALCITLGAKLPKADTAATSEAEKTYITEEEAIEYLGINKEVMTLMRDRLKSFEGAYMSYTYVDENGEEVTFLVYDKDALDTAMDKVMKEHNKLNFKYLQEAEKAQEAQKTEKAAK